MTATVDTRRGRTANTRILARCSLAVLLMVSGKVAARAPAQETRNRESVEAPPQVAMRVVGSIDRFRNALSQIDVIYCEDQSSNEYYAASGGYQSAGYMCELASDGVQRFFMLRTLCDEYGPYDADEVVHYYKRGAAFMVLRPTRHYCETWIDPSPGPEVQWTQRFFRSLGVTPFAEEEAAEPSYFLPGCLRSEGYECHRNRDLIDGAPCLRFENPRGDRIWIDESNRYSVRRREWSSRQQNGASRFYTVICWDFRKVADDLVLPFRCIATIDEGSARETSQRYLTNTVVVHSVQVSNVRPDLFRPTLGPGTICFDRNTRQSVFVPGGEELLDDVADELSAGFPLATSPFAYRRPAAGPDLLLTLAAVSVACLAVLLAFREHRRINSRPPARDSSPGTAPTSGSTVHR